MRVRSTDKKNNFRTKAFRAGGYSMAASAIVIIIAVILNLLVGTISTAYTSIDTTDAGLYSISKQTKTILSALDEDVTIYYIATQDAQAGYIEKLLDKYNAAGQRLNVEHIDPDVSPDFAETFTDETATNGDLLVTAGKKAKLIHYTDMVQYEAGSYENYFYYLQAGQQTEVYWNGETELTKAIDFVTSNKTYHVYFIDVGDSENIPVAQSLLENENMICADLPESAAAVPDDASCLILTGAQNDISDNQFNIISSYIEKGGKVCISADCGGDAKPNIDRLLSLFGLSFTAATIEDGDSHYETKDVIRPQYADSHPVTAPFTRADYVYYPKSAGITAADNEDITVTPMLFTSNSAYLSTDKSNDLHFRVFDLAVSAENKKNGAQAIVFGTSAFMQTAYLTDSRYANSDLFINAVAFLCDKDSAVTLHAKAVTSDNTLDFTRTNTGFIVFLLSILPAVAAVIAGFAIWFRRRNK